MKIHHTVHFTFPLALPLHEAVRFTQDVGRSLSQVEFLQDLQLLGACGESKIVAASIPINAAFFGQHDLSFRSHLIPTDTGARLEALPHQSGDGQVGWAEVAGVAQVYPTEGASEVTYAFDFTVHLDLPEPERWGGRALLKMVELTAQTVLETITRGFPQAVQAAAEAQHYSHV